MDEHGLFPGAAGARGWLGALLGADEVGGRGSVGEQGPGRDAAARAHARAKRVLWARPVHAHNVFAEMPACARVHRGGWGLAGLG